VIYNTVTTSIQIPIIFSVFNYGAIGVANMFFYKTIVIPSVFYSKFSPGVHWVLFKGMTPSCFGSNDAFIF
jgi:hypothetical protein